MSPASLKLALVGVLALLLITAGGVWKVQDWRYGKQLAGKISLHRSDLATISNAAVAQVCADQGKRLALEHCLSGSEPSHYTELSDAQTNQARLRDRLATTDLRLSVLLDVADPVGCCAVATSTGAGASLH